MKYSKLENAKIKRGFRTWLIEAKGVAEATADQIFRSIALYEDCRKDESYALFNRDRALEYKETLRKKRHNGKTISQNSIRTYLIHLKSFFEWLGTQPGYKKITPDSLEYLKVSKKESRLAAQRTIRKYPLMEYISKLVLSIDVESEVDQRDQALISFCFLTGMRDSALTSLPLGNIDEKKLYVFQNPHNGVKTKFSKIIYSKIFRFDEELLSIVIDWINTLKSKGYSIHDPLFPRSKSVQISEGYSFKEATEVEPRFWTTSNSIRNIFKQRAEKANLQYFPPHTFRHAAIYYALKFACNGEEIKAISQNFGHEDISTTLSTYAQYSPDHLFEVLDKMEFNENEDIKDIDMKMKIDLIYKNIIGSKD